MPTLTQLQVDELARARIGRLLTRYRAIIFALLLAIACALAYADRQHARDSAPRIEAGQVGAAD